MRDHKLSNVALALVMFVSIGLAVAGFVALARDERGTYGMTLEWRPEGSGGEQALTIASVAPGSPAAKAGLEPGHLIVKFHSFDDRVLLALQGNLPLHSYVRAGQPVSFFFERHITIEPMTLVAAPTPSENHPLWLYELRIAIYLLSALIVGALVASRPSAITWGFAIFVIFGMVPLAEPLEFVGLVASPTGFLVTMLLLYTVDVFALLGLVVFATRFPRGTPPPLYTLVERIAIALAFLAAGAVCEASLGKLWGWPALDSGVLEFVRALLFSVIAVAMLAMTYARSRGSDRIRLAWAIAGPSIGTLCIVADHWCYTQGFETAATVMGLFSSIAPFSMMYAILRHRVIDVRFPLEQRFAETVVAVDANAGEKPDRRELVRRSALLLSADLPFEETLGQFASLLAAFVDATSVLIVAGNAERARLEYQFEDGKGSRPDQTEIPSESLTAKVLRTGTAVLVKGAEDWPTEEVVSVGGVPSNYTQSALFVPVAFGGATVGAISVQSQTAAAYDDSDLELLESCALYLGARIHDEEQRRVPEPALPLMEIDGPTGLARADVFDLAFEREWQLALKMGKTIAVLVIEVDLFDAFIDAYGTPAADTCLRQIARVVRSKISGKEFVAARYGDERFAVLLPGYDLQAAIALAEEMRASVASLNVAHHGSTLGTLSISVGAAARVPEHRILASSLVQEARLELDFAESHGRNRVCAAGYRSEAPQSERRAFVHTNLAQPDTALFGRLDEIVAIEDAFSMHPAIVVAGAAGTGKTRLLGEIGLRTLEGHRDGVWYVDLANTDGKDAIAQTVADTIFSESKGVVDATRLGDLMSDMNVLLLLDNGDHLDGACERFAVNLAGHAVGVWIVVASRDPKPGGWVYPLEALSIEDAVALYLDRTQRAFGSSGQGAIAARVVERLGRNPLAIELAATLPELPDALTGDAPAPQGQIVPALLAWTYESLSADAATVLRRISVFEGDWTVEAACAVTGDVSSEAVATALRVLEARTLVTRTGTEKMPRYRLAEKIRTYARAKLQANDDANAANDRFVRFFGSYADDLVERKAKLSYAEWARAQRCEFVNYREAFRRALRGSHSPAVAGKIVRSLLTLLEPAFGADFAPQLKRSTQSDAIGTEERAVFWLALCELSRASAPSDALRAARHAFELYRDLGDQRGMAYAAWYVAGASVRARGSIDPATEPSLRAGLRAARAIGDRQLAVGLLRNVAFLCGEETRHEDAREALREAAEIADRTDVLSLATLVGSTALEEFHARNFDESAQLWRRAAALAEEASSRYAGLCLVNAGLAELSRGDKSAGRIFLQRSLTQLRSIGHRYGQALALSHIARLARDEGDAERAARIAGFTETFFERGPARTQTEQRLHAALVDDLRTRLGHSTFERERGRGLWMSLDDAVAEGLAA